MPPTLPADAGAVQRIRPTGWRSLDRASDASLLSTLFDERAGIGLLTNGPARFRLDFLDEPLVETIGVYDTDDGALAVIPDDPTLPEQVIELRKGGRHWHRFAIAKPTRTPGLTLEWRPAQPGAMLRELELWGRAASKTSPARASAPLPAALFQGLPAGAGEFRGMGPDLPISVATVFGGSEAGTFHVKMDQDPGRFARVFLVYELARLPHFTATMRMINGRSLAARAVEALGGSGGLQVEEISSRWLVPGDNLVQFLPIDESDPVGYEISRLRIVGVPPAQSASANAEVWAGLSDGRDDTVWEGAKSKKLELRDWAFTSVSQPEGVSFRLTRAGAGTLQIWAGNRRSSANVRIGLEGLAPGWHHVALANLPASEQLLLSLAGETEQKVALSELAINASPLPTDDAPRMRITYPLSGECVNHRVYVRGFIDPAGPAELFVNGRQQAGAIADDGSLAFELSERDVGGQGGRAFKVSVEARYAGGARVRRMVNLDGCVERPAVVRGDDGHLRQPVEDAGAPYLAVVRAKSATTLAFADATVEVPAGAVERDVRLSIRPLANAKLAPMDPGMTNVTPGQQAFRFGPHGMVFKKPVKLALPYDKALVPQGYTEADIRTFYYDEGLKKWQQVGLLAQGKGTLLALSEHFTDFINATISSPESPGTVSMNPTSMKDIKLANPAAGISLIEAPEANSQGTANLRYPIEVPPGRRGLAPRLDVAYTSDGGNGWLGQGWDIHLSSIEIDTRFGVPKYDGSETYLLDGEALTGPDANGVFHRRVEGPFERIVRQGNDPTTYYWEVTDKGGTVRRYGADCAGKPSCARLSDPSSSRPANIFRWYLENVEDPYGNAMNLSYAKDTGNNGEPWVQLYPTSIDYTRHGPSGLAAAYHVQFVLEGTPRSDVIINARPGFQVLTRYRLDYVDVLYGAEVIRRYRMAYNTGDYHKSLLASIAQYGHLGTHQVAQHTFDYYSMATVASNGQTVPDLFAPPQGWGQVRSSSTSLRTEDGLTRTDGDMQGGSGSIGIGYSPSASISVGGSVFGGGERTQLRPLDLTGDGLADLVDESGRTNFGSMSNAQGYGRFGFGAVSGLWDYGLGYTASDGYSASGHIGTFLSGTYTNSGSYERNIVTDVNGDGFPDLVFLENGAIKAQLNDGQGNFGQGMPWGELSIEDVSTSHDDWAAQADSQTIHTAPLTRWIAPFAGEMTISGTLWRRAEGPDPVTASIYKGNTLLWKHKFNGNDTIPCSPGQGPADPNVGHPCADSSHPLIVQDLNGGEKFYTLLSATGSVKNTVFSWSPIYQYTASAAEKNLVTPYGSPIHLYDQESDFHLSGPPSLPWTATAAGKVVVEGGFAYKGSVSDNLRLQVRRVPKNGQPSVIQLADVAAWATGPITVGPSNEITVSTGDRLHLEAVSDTTIDTFFAKWEPTLRYTEYCAPMPGGANPLCGPVSCATVGNDTRCTVNNNPDSTVPGSIITQKVLPEYTVGHNYPYQKTRTFVASGSRRPYFIHAEVRKGDSSPAAVMLIQSVNRLIDKISLPAGYHTEWRYFTWELDPGEQLFFSLVVKGESVGNIAFITDVDNDEVGHNVWVQDPAFGEVNGVPRDAMSGGYHQWFFGDWDASVPFNEDLIVMPQPQAANAFGFMVPAPSGFSALTQPLWAGRGYDGYIAAGQQKPSLGSKSGNLANTLRIASTWNFDLDAGAYGVGVGANMGETTSDRDFFDFNGDGFPDSITKDGVRFNDGNQGLGLKQSIGPHHEALRRVAHRSVRLSGGAGASLVNKTDSQGQTSSLVSTGFNLGLNYGISATQIDYVDINGDGLPDQVKKEAGSQDPDLLVRLNLGYGLSGEIHWGNAGWQQQLSGLRSDVIYASDDFGGAVKADVVRLADTGTNSGGVGATYEGIGASAGVTNTLARTVVAMVDINGDGLADQLMRQPGETDGNGKSILRVKLNLGDRFAAEETWPVPSWGVPMTSSDLENMFQGSKDALEFSYTHGWSASAQASGCIYFVCLSGGWFYSDGTGANQLGFEDMDGDGHVDHVLKQDGDATVLVKLNQTGKSNLLSVVHRPLGGTIELDYQRYGNHRDVSVTPNIDMPRTQWALSRVTSTDGRGGRYTSTMDYSATSGPDAATMALGSGFYDRAERESYGYAHVAVTRGLVQNGVVTEGDGSRNERFYLNYDYYHRGLLSAEYELAPDGKVMRGTRIGYEGASVPPGRSGWYFPKEVGRTTYYFEGTTSDMNASADKYHVQSRAYDATGNLTDLWDEGDNQGDTGVHVGPDNVHYTIGYTTEPDTYITRPSSILAVDSQNNILRSRAATYYPGKGAVQTLTNYIYGGKDPTSGSTYNGSASTHTYTYDGYGNVLTYEDPKQYKLRYAYDSVAQTYATRTDDISFGYYSLATPNYLYGANADVTDINGQKTKYSFDGVGRLDGVFGPNDQAQGASPTVAMVYAPDASPPWALTRHKDVQRPTDSIDTATFIDGLGRVIQTKKDIDYDITGTGTPATGMSVTGLVAFDSRGRVASQGQPVFSTEAQGIFVTVPDLNPTKYRYDSLGRIVEVLGPDGAKTTTEYLVSTADPLPEGLAVSGTWLATRVRDALGNSPSAPAHTGERVTYDDLNGHHVAVKEYNQIGAASGTLTALITQYQYNPMGDLLKVIDAKMKETLAEYDSLGHMVTLTSPDAGKTEYRYDVGGNLGAKQTAVLAGQNKLIKYEYDWNRLKKIDYPTTTDVTYTYGTNAERGGTGNLAGRMKQVTMEGGSELRYYDAMGNVSQTVTTLKHLAQPSIPDQVFTMKFSYDSFGRMQTMTFPNWIKNDWKVVSGEGELVSYTYDHGGNLQKITGYQQTQNPEHPEFPRNFAYLNHIGYDEFEQRTVLTSGNGIVNKYGYDLQTRRLATIDASSLGAQERQLKKPATPFHAMRYYYDLMGNITKLENATTVYTWQNASVRTGPLRMEYTYDNLYQLKSATGKYRPDRGYGYDYSSTFQYDEGASLLKKSQLERRLVWDNQNPPTGLAALDGSRVDHTVSSFSYTLDYTYGGTRPHAASKIKETSSSGSANDHVYSYDNNGNNTGNTYMGATRTMTWDEENRLKQVTDATTMRGKFLYTPDGERTQKQTAAGDSFYVNQFYAVKPSGILPTKHIFAGETRIVSKTDPISQVAALSYYHPDNLGSTSYTSAGDQTLLQHERYFPFGERDIGDQEECDLGRPDNMRRDWIFTSKELDFDTGLYYFGARYFDPKMSVWQSTDPVLGQYMQGEVNRGVFGTRNLALYSYTWNNPVRYIDPDGMVCAETGASGPCGGGSGTHDPGLVDLPTFEREPVPLLATMTPIVGPVLDFRADVESGHFGWAAINAFFAIFDGLTAGKFSAQRGLIVAEGRGLARNTVRQELSAAEQSRTYQTYTKTKATTGEVYSGRTSGTGTPEQNIARRDSGHHMSDQGYGPAVLDKSSDKRAAIRGREQQLIDRHGGAKSQGGTSGNQLNGISPRNPKRATYMQAAKKEFKR